jgi:glutamyl-tRNA reductase
VLIAATGMSHRTAPVEVRERVAFRPAPGGVPAAAR